MDINRLCLNCMEGTIGPDGRCVSCGCGQLTMQEPPYALPTGMVLHGRYIIGRVVGQGGFGITYLAYDLQNAKKVVLKELYPSMLVQRNPGDTDVVVYKDQEFFIKCRDRFVDEARLIYSLRNVPEIVDVYHIFIENNTGYYAMEFLGGETLQSQMKYHKKCLTWEQIIPIASNVGAALRALHAEGNIHRDISPDNIFILLDGRVKLIDFGAARQYGNRRGYTEILKKGFAPYEQYQREGNQGPWTDLYAFAATIYYCLTRKMVPDAPSRILGDSLQPPSYYGAAVPPEVEAALVQALKVKPELRFSSVDAFMKALGVEMRPFSPSELDHKQPQEPTSGVKTQMQWFLRGIHGLYAGKKIYLGNTFVLGRDPQKCDLVYPQNAPGVSRMQLSINLTEDGNRYLKCESASQMIYINGTAIYGQGKTVPLHLGDRIAFGQNQIFVLERQG